jgi:hypothetical protein
MHDVTLDVEVRLNQFNKLIQELLRGTMSRNCFQAWEIEILLDIEGCNLKDGSRRETLKRYQKAVQRDVEKGAQKLLKLSEYLERVKAKRSRSSADPARTAVPTVH